jgi:hypothetical protein
MNKILLAVILSIIAGSAYAACTTNTIFQGTKIVTCMTCCDSNGNCTTSCH